MSLSDADLKKVADQLFLLKHPAPVKLAEPGNTPALEAKLNPIATSDDFKNCGIGVADFTTHADAPDTFLHKGDEPWRVGSTGKIALLLAAVQLRDDVRQVQELKLISTAKEFDDLFKTAKLWKKSKFADARRLGDPATAPRISTIFDVAKTPVDFIGPDPDSPDKTGIAGRLPADGELTWEKAADFSFSERLWLAGARSDNVAADSCISEIGVDYMKAVQRAYGLYDDAHNRGLLLAGPYSKFKKNTPVNRDADAPKFRPLINIETSYVHDGIFNNKTNAFDDHASWEGGTAAALTAYVIALMKDELVDPDHEDTRGIQGCKTIRNNLSAGTRGIETRCPVADGIGSIAGVTISKQISKIGLLDRDVGEPGPLDCEFAFVEVAAGPKFAILITGLKSRIAASELGKAIFTALR